MKRSTHTIKKSIVRLSLIALGTLALGSISNELAKAQDANTSYTRDPFAKPKRGVAAKPKTKVAKAVKPAPPAPVLVAAPPVQDRINAYKTQKAAAISAQLPAPKVTTALLLDEVQVIGIFRTPRGYAAMVEATPIKLSYVIYPGESFYDGRLVAIEENRLVFRRETKWADGRREMTVATKPLRTPDAVTDSLSAPSTSKVSATNANIDNANPANTIAPVNKNTTQPSRSSSGLTSRTTASGNQ